MHNPFAPFTAIASPFGAALAAVAAAGRQPTLMLFRPPPPGPRPVTHLAKKCLQMRHKISTQAHNPLKKEALKPHD